MRHHLWYLLLLLLVSSCSNSFDQEEQVHADLAQIFTLHKKQLLERRAALLSQIELVAAARQGSYQPLVAQSKSLLGVGYGCYNYLEQLQQELLQAAKIPVAADTTVPPLEQPHWRHYEAKLTNKKIGNKLLFKEAKGAEKIVQDWQKMADDYKTILQTWSSSPVIYAERFPFEDRADNQLYRWKDKQETPAQLAATYFEGETLVVILTRLLQLQTDILAHEVQLLRWLLENMSLNYLNNDKYTIIAQSPTPVVPVGEAYQAKINLMLYPSQGEVEIRVNGETVSTEGGMVNYETTPERAGTHTLALEVLLKNPYTQEQERYTHSISYVVVE